MRVRLNLDRLHEIIARSNLSQNHWAIKLSLSRGHWSEILNGKYPFPSPKTRERMLEVFGVPFDQLFELVEQPAEGSDASLQAALADRYAIDRPIGQGGMGSVYLARDVKLGRPVAIKVVSPEFVSGIGVAQFLKEIRYTARLQHPHILPLYDAGEAAGYPFYVTPFIREGSLRQLLERSGIMPLETVLKLLEGISAALDHAHQQQILHCDIKPENILIHGDHPFVADFGISRAVHAEAFEWGHRSTIDSSAGTPAYVSPEQASGQRHLDARSDVYSLACVAFEMLTGRPPFTGNTTLETVTQRFTTPPPDLQALAPRVPGGIAAAITRAMSLAPARRQQTVRAFNREIHQRTSTPSGRRTAAQRLLLRAATPARRVGSVPVIAKGAKLMHGWAQDIHHAVRSLRRRPAFSAIVTLTLALGIGATTAIFSVLYGVLWRPLPFPDAQELVQLTDAGPASPANYLDLRRDATLLQDLAAASVPRDLTVTGIDPPLRVRGVQVNAGFFDLFGLPPAVGRNFQAADDVQGAAPTVILSNQLWRSAFSADPDIVGSTLTVNGIPMTAVGVTSADFRFPDAPNKGVENPGLFVPFWWDPANPGRGSRYILIYGRRKPDASLDAVRAEISGLFDRLVDQYPAANGQWRGRIGVEALTESWFGSNRGPLLILGGAVVLVLLVSCANVANLLLARAEGRQREMAVRIALGAGRTRVVRHFVTESMTLAIIGGILGTAVAAVSVRAIVAGFGSFIPSVTAIGINGLVLVFALGTSLLTGMIVGVVPALRASRADAIDALKSGGRSITGRTRLRAALVIAEIALSLMLVFGAGLLLRSYWYLQGVDLGVEPNGFVAFHVNLSGDQYRSSTAVVEFHESVLRDIERLPGVTSVGITNMMPFGRLPNNVTRVWEYDDPENETRFVEVRYASQDFFDALGMTRQAGRSFTAQEVREDLPVVAITETLARRLFSDRNPIGLRIGGWGDAPLEVVAVYGDLREYGPQQDVRPTMYRPGLSSTSSWVVRRADGNPLDLMPAVRDIVHRRDAKLPIYGVARGTSLVADTMGSRRFQLTLITIFAAVALVLGAVGIYGVMSYSVAQRTQEVGVRLALGASSRGVVASILKSGLTMAAIGAALGTAGAFALRKILETLLIGVSSTDWMTFVAVTVLLLTIAAAACVIPARHAARIDPMKALRME